MKNKKKKVVLTVNGRLVKDSTKKPHLQFGTTFKKHRLGTNGGMPIKVVESSVRQNRNTTGGHTDEYYRIDKCETWWSIIEDAKKWEKNKEKKKK